MNSATKFRTKPSNDYLGNVINLFDRRTRVYEAEIVLKKIPMQFDHYPSIAQLEETINSVQRELKAKAKSNNMEVSTYKPLVNGTPVVLEALFKYIDQGQINSRGFLYGLKYFKLSEDKVFEYYEAWKQGKTHKEVREGNWKLNIKGASI